MASSSWPFDYLNTLSPANASPSNPLVTATSAQDLSLTVDSSELTRQLEAWTNVTFDFGDDNCASSAFGDSMSSHGLGHMGPAEAAGDLGAAGGSSFKALLGVADHGDSDPSHDVGTQPSYTGSPTFANEQAFRISHCHQQLIALPSTSDTIPAAATFAPAGPLSFSTLLAANEGLSTLLANQPDPFAGLPLLGPYPNIDISRPSVATITPASTITTAITRAGSTSMTHPPAKRTAPNRRAPVKASLSASGASRTGAEGSPSETDTVAVTARGDEKRNAVAGGAVDCEEAANKQAIEEDKRRRNTAASARFRVKKKLREQAMERKTDDLRQRVNELEKEIDGLKKENGWLRGLIVDRAMREAESDPVLAGIKRGRECEE